MKGSRNMVQTNISEWDVVDEQIQRSKIKRFPYKSMIGQSLTDYIISCQREGLSSHQTIARLLKEQGIIDYLTENRFDTHKLQENIRISVCARFSEERMRGRK